MPILPKHVCGHPGCPALVEYGKSRCPEHMAQMRKRQDAGRPNFRERGYDSRWDKVRKAYLSEYPLCERCQAAGRSVPAILVHHRDRVPANMADENLEALCRECHEQEHRGERFGNG